MATPIIYILYNADASVVGKLTYGYRKITGSKDKPVCGACDITHGGLHLDETNAWKEAKADLTKGGVMVKQLHKDELNNEIKTFVEKEDLSFPMVLEGDEQGGLKVVLSRQDIDGCGGDAKMFVQRLKEKSPVDSASASSL